MCAVYALVGEDGHIPSIQSVPRIFAAEATSGKLMRWHAEEIDSNKESGQTEMDVRQRPPIIDCPHHHCKGTTQMTRMTRPPIHHHCRDEGEKRVVIDNIMGRERDAMIQMAICEAENREPRTATLSSHFNV